MRSIIIENSVPVLKEVDPARCGKNQVLVKNELIGVNNIDLYYMTGQYGAKLCGHEAYGTIASADNSDKFKVGDKVYYSTASACAYAEYSAVNQGLLIPVDDSINPLVLTAYGHKMLTSVMLFDYVYKVIQNKGILLHGADTPEGLIYTQMLAGYQPLIFATVLDSKNTDLVKESGAHFVYDYHNDDWADIILGKTKNIGIHAVFNHLPGDAKLKDSLRVLMYAAHFIHHLAPASMLPVMTLQELEHKSLFMTVASIFQYMNLNKQYLFDAFAQVLEALKEADLSAALDSVGRYKLEDVPSTILQKLQNNASEYMVIET